MKRRRKYLYLLFMLIGLLMLLGTGASAEVKTVQINGVKYDCYYINEEPVARAHIDDVRGKHLAAELYIPSQITYKNVTYQVRNFVWGVGRKYINFYGPHGANAWKRNVVIPDRSHSYHACLKKITFADGVKVYGPAYDYGKLKHVVFENPKNLKQALFYNCPKLKRLHLTSNVGSFGLDIKNCPSLKVTIDEDHPYLKMVGNDICSKDGKLMNAITGKKYYKVPKGITEISQTAFWGDTSIEKIHTGKAPVRAEGLPNLKRVKVNKDASEYDTFYWNSLAYSKSLKRVDIPESVCYIYGEYEDYPIRRGNSLASVKDVYLYSKNLKGGWLDDIPVKTTFHVRSKKVAKQLRKYGYYGKIVIEKNMR